MEENYIRIKKSRGTILSNEWDCVCEIFLCLCACSRKIGEDSNQARKREGFQKRLYLRIVSFCKVFSLFSFFGDRCCITLFQFRLLCCRFLNLFFPQLLILYICMFNIMYIVSSFPDSPRGAPIEFWARGLEKCNSLIKFHYL